MSTTDAEPKDAVLLAALGEGMSYAKAAEVAGVSKATVQRRMTDGEFRARVRQQRQANAEEAGEMLEGLAVKAAGKVGELVGAESEMVALKAAFAVLDKAEARRQARSFGDRLSRLELAIEQLVEQSRRPRAA